MTQPVRFTESYWPADTSAELHDLTVGELLRDAAADAPASVALVGGDPDPAQRRRWTYAELLRDAERTARALLGRFEPGERVAVWAPNVPEWVVLEFGAALAGVVLVTVNPALTAGEVAYVLRQSRSSGLFHTDEFRGASMVAVLDEIRPELDELREVVSFSDWASFLDAGDPATPLPSVAPGDPAQIQYTSGTTGFPKGALLGHRGIVNNANLIAQRMGVPTGSAWVNPMPLFHTGGCVIAALGTVWRRATHVLVPYFDPALVLELVESERAVQTGAVPTMLIAELARPEVNERDFSRLQCVVSGGATVPAPLVRQTEKTFGVDVVIVFGQTELAPVVTMTRPDDSADDKADTIGQPLPQVEVKVIDPATGEILPVGEQGEICARGYQLMLGYFELPDATAATIDPDGWLHTGDLGSMDDRGYFRITGRLKDMIIRGGENLFPREIEERLIDHPGVSDVAVLGLPDDYWGERVVAVVTATDAAAPPTAAELADWCRAALARHKTPVAWYLAQAFPLTGSGKIQKFVLREQVTEGALPELP
jgi:fatty-acyl-CoA synthase